MMNKREDWHEIGKIGTEILKKTISTGKEAFKEVKDSLPKEASHLLQRGKEELTKGLSQEFAANVVNRAIDKLFDVVTDHEFAITFSIRKKKSANQGQGADKHSSAKRRNHKPE